MLGSTARFTPRIISGAATFCILRKAFIDRTIQPAELTSMAEMIGHWYVQRAAPRRAEPGRIWCEAIIYAAARPVLAQLRDVFAENLALEAKGASADELRVVGAASDTGAPPDASIWLKVLAEPLVRRACVRLMLNIEAPIVADDGGPDLMNSTIVLCGAPADRSLDLKAIWNLGHDQSMELVYRYTDWHWQTTFLEAFDAYQHAYSAGRGSAAVQESLAKFRQTGKLFFLARRDEGSVMWMVRKQVELPDERGPAALARRLAAPFGTGAALLLLPLLITVPIQVTLICLFGAIYMVWLASKLLWKKFLSVRATFHRMRTSLGNLYDQTPVYKLIDLSSDGTSTLVKASAELEDLGAKHICDISVQTANLLLDGNRIYTLGDSSARIGLLRRTENFAYFPAKPVISIGTQFADGRRHETTNSTLYRKGTRPGVTARCLTGEGEAQEVFARHRRHVDRMIAAGAVPLSPPATPEEALQNRLHFYEEGRLAWQRSPYSWKDALHQTFKVCRREFLKD